MRIRPNELLIGIRRAVGATEADVRRQFLSESVLQCLIGGAIGIALGFVCAMLLRRFTAFPAAVQTWVAVLGLVLSCSSGSIQPCGPRLDPVAALRVE